ncbi:Gfo/Idh/MocA family protein [Bosea psychrotolerans]|uniref:Putative dehydrogenase n=1 Tax=Bosea psychrotolerans TaxID=1871628 RepID=A0A2S4M9N2_9HYPH|nr:Gfo/Idh/MocA family oxidoreductase [Bosea psychrotolerans]POR51371.1 putative dehydrogenase [Bosea psychrotolerans]
MSAKLNIALVGAGLIGRAHLQRLDISADCTCAAICDPTDAARALAAERGTPWFASPEAMLAAITPDGAIIATPNVLHVPGALACLEAGVPVLVEKPLAESVASAQRLVEAQARTGIPVLAGHHRRHNPIVKAARKIVQDGGIGRLVAISSLFLIRKPDDYFDVAWRREAGGGPVLINLIHDIDNLRFICGEIDAVQAMNSNATRGFAVEDTAALTFRFTNGALGTATVSDATPAPWSWELTSGENKAYPQRDGHCYLIAGSEGSLSLPKLELWRYEGKQGWWEPLLRESRAVAPVEPLAEQLRHFCAVIRGTEQAITDAADATRTLAVVEAIGEAARHGHLVSIDHQARAQAA